MTPQEIASILSERAVLRQLADEAIRARGELQFPSAETRAFLDGFIDEVTDRWAVADKKARAAWLSRFGPWAMMKRRQ